MTNAIRKFSARSPRRAFAAVALLVLAVSATAGVFLQGHATADTQDPAIATAAETAKAFTAVTKTVAPAVVFIKATKQTMMTGNIPGMNGDMPGMNGLQGQIPDEMLRRFFGDRLPEFPAPHQQPRPSVGEGSGFLISKDGYILTNNHVVGGANRLEVALHDGRKMEAKLVGTDAHTDVALIKVEGQDLPVLPMGDSDAIEVGEWVLAVGSPFGLTGTVTSGIVSAKGRDGMGITDYENFLQTDAAINPGNSGGPLVNLQGQAVGINTAILSSSGGYNGIGFAIPMNMAKQVCDQLMEHGTVTRGFLGVIIQPLTPELAKSFGLGDATGVLIGDVSSDGPAAKIGLQRGDVIVKFNGEPVKDTTSFRNRVAMITPETSVNLEVLRDGQPKTFSLQVGKLPDNDSVAAAQTESIQSWGLTVQSLDEQLAEKLGVESTRGVVVTEVDPNSVAGSAGMRPGMVITEVNRKPVTNAREFDEAAKAAKDSDTLLLLVHLEGHSRYLALQKTR
ncbi:MAG: DegQ family serine endoprotease [Pirellulaceae bacterium]